MTLLQIPYFEGSPLGLFLAGVPRPRPLRGLLLWEGSLYVALAQCKKAGLKLNIQKTKIMASGPITSWEIDGETVETVSDFIFGAPKSLQMVIAAMKLKDTYSLEGKL